MELLVLQQIAGEGPGLLEETATRRGDTLRVAKPFEGEPIPPLAGFDALVVLGGPMNVYEEEAYPYLRDEDRLLRQAIKSGVPVLGICLGAQLLAKALGASVRPNERKEIGYLDVALTEEGRSDPLFARLSSSLPVFQWHGDTFDVPLGSALLATSELCTNQAFRHGRAAYGLQFHLEVTPQMVGKWVSQYRDELDEVLGVRMGGRLVKDANLMEWLIGRQADLLFSNFLELARHTA